MNLQGNRTRGVRDGRGDGGDGGSRRRDVGSLSRFTTETSLKATGVKRVGVKFKIFRTEIIPDLTSP